MHNLTSNSPVEKMSGFLQRNVAQLTFEILALQGNGN
jgi:hypothetical protein